MLIDPFSMNDGGQGFNPSPKIVPLHPEPAIKKKRSRLVVQKGLEQVVLKLDDIVLFFTENKLVFVVDHLEKKYLVDSCLCDLEKELNPACFFRANRQYIINIDHLRSFRAYEKVKIRVDMNLSAVNHFIVVSQESAPHFRKWVQDA